MSSSGFVSAMIASLKRNKRSRRTTIYDQADLHYTNGVNPEYLKEATPEVMAEIKEQIRREKKQEKRQWVIALLIAVICVCLLFCTGSLIG